MAIKIMMDAGHGGTDPGAVYEGRQEKDDALRLMLAVGELLQNKGYDVDYTRVTDIYDAPYQKARKANIAEADYFVSIHRNSFPTPNAASGVETLIYDASGVKLEMAENVNNNLVSLGFRDLGVKERPNLVVLNSTDMPSILVEAGFINSDEDNRLFDEKFDEIALAIADGVSDTIAIAREPERTYYRVQVGLYRNREYADNLLNELLAAGYPAFLSYDNGLYKVEAGAFTNLQNAIRMEQRLRSSGYNTVIVTA